MPTCPSCNSITLTANGANTFCISAWDVVVDCVANPYLKDNWRIEYSSDDGATDPWKPVERVFAEGDFYPIYLNLATPTDVYMVTQTSANNLDDITGYTTTLKHSCEDPSYFQDNGDGYYRVGFKFEYLSGDTCIQNSNSIQIQLSATTAASHVVDKASLAGCVCNSTDPTYGASAELAVNWSATTSECFTGCSFEYYPTFILETNGDVNYHLPESKQDRTVKLFNIGTIGNSVPDGFAMTKNQLYFQSETANYITEVSYQWPGMREPSIEHLAPSNTANSFKVGHYLYDLNQWQAGAFLEHPQPTLLNIQHRQRKIWSKGPNLLPNYKIFDAATNSSGYKSMAWIDFPAMANLLTLEPESYAGSIKSIYHELHPVSGGTNCEDATFLADNPLGCAYAALYACDLGEGGSPASTFGFIVAADYDASDSSGDLSSSVFLNLNPFCRQQDYVIWGLAPDLDAGWPAVTGNSRQGWGLLGETEKHGFAVDYARDTDTIIVGSPFANNLSNIDTGKIEVFTLDGASLGQNAVWTPKGQIKYSSNNGGHSGGAVAINADGSIIATGQYDGGTAGHRDVRVYIYNGGTLLWDTLGFDIAFGAMGNGTQSLALSDDGHTLIIGKAFELGGGVNRGQVFVTAWSGSAWVQKGTTISGGTNGDYLGGSVAINNDGTFIAMTTSTGEVKTYEWSGSAWTSYANITTPGNLNASMTSASATHTSFNTVALNKAGDRIAIGYPFYDGGTGNTLAKSGLVRVYKKDSGSWLQVGGDIEGPEVAGVMFGSSIDLDDTGYIVSTSAPGQHSIDFGITYTDVGRMHQYVFNETAWNPKYGMDIDEPTVPVGWDWGCYGNTGCTGSASGIDSFTGETANSVACRGDGHAIIIGSPSFGNIFSGSAASEDGAWNVIHYCTRAYYCSNYTMFYPEEIQAEDMAGGWLYPDNGIYDGARSNPGHLPSVNTDVGITSGFNYKTYPTTDIVTISANNHFTAYSFDAGNTLFNSGTANTPCTGLTDCPPFYHSTDAGARSTNTGLLSIINKTEFVCGIVGEHTHNPTNATAIKIKNADGTDNLDPVIKEGWYQTKAQEVSGEIYNMWSASNYQTPTNSVNGTKQHWAGTPAGMNFHTRLSDNSFDSFKYGSLESTIFELYFRIGNSGSSTKTARYAFDPFTLLPDYGIIPYQVANPSGEASVTATDSSSASRKIVNSCQNASALNYFGDIYPMTPWTPAQGVSRKIFQCIWCDSLSGNTESYNGDDGIAGDIESSFEHVSISVTHPTYQNWGDGVITHTVNRMPLFSSMFPSPLPNYRYKAVLYRVDQPGDSWQHPMSYIPAGGIQDMLTTPVVTFSTTGYPAPLLVPEGNYSIKWSINVLDPGVYEIEECWWEYPVTLTAQNSRPNPPIFTLVTTHPSYYYFRVMVQDTWRSVFDSGGYPPTNSPIHAPSSASFNQCWEGQCIDTTGALNGIPGENITLYDPSTMEPNSGYPKYTTPEACIGGGFTWEGFDRIANVEDVTPVPYGGTVLNAVYTNTHPLLNITNGSTSFHNLQSWQAYYVPNVGPGNWWAEPSGSLWPSEQIQVKVTYESGWTKTFTLTTPVVYNKSDNPNFNGWWDLDGALPCTAEMWPTHQYLYNEPQLYFYPYNPNIGTTANKSYTYGSQQLMTPQSNNALPASPIIGEKVNIWYHQVHEDTLTPAPTYPLPMYEGVTAPEAAVPSNGSYDTLRLDLSRGRAESFGQERSAVEYGTAITANHIMGGFTGELVMRQGQVVIAKAWADANPSLIPTVAGHRSVLGTSHNIYDNLITSMLAGTGAQGNNTHTSPAIIPGVGEAGTLTEAKYTNIIYGDQAIYAKDCPVCLPPSTDKACRYGYVGASTNNYVDNLPVGGGAVTIVKQAVNFIDNDPFPNTEQFDDGSCMYCDVATGKLKSDGWDATDNDPPYLEWYDTNPYPEGNLGGSPGDPDYNTATMVAGTGNILSTFNGISVINNVTGTVNTMDTTFSLGGVSYTFYKIEMGTVGACATEGYADDTTSIGAFKIFPELWGDFITALSINMDLINLGFIIDLLKWNGASWDVVSHNVYNGGTVPTVSGGYLSGYVDIGVGATVPLTYGHYKARIRVYDFTQAWTGQQPISWCYQEIPLNFRVLACADGSGGYVTEDGVYITDANLVHVDNTCVSDACDCCPQVTASLQVGGTACSPTHTIQANYSCTAGQQVTQLDMVLWYIPPMGVATVVGSFPTVVGSITSGFQAFGSIITGQAAIDGGQYYIVTTYTNTNGATCVDSTGPALLVPPLPTCECQDNTATNYLLVYPGGNADCNGVIGGSDYSCCLYESYCGIPTVTVTETACAINVAGTTSCTLGVLPDTVTLQYFDVSTTGNVWDPNTQVPTVFIGTYTPATIAPPYTLITGEDCTTNGVTVMGGPGTYVLKQTQIWASGYSLVTVSAPFTITSTHYPIICGCMNPLGSNYNAAATCDDGSCIFAGCMDGGATGYTSTLGFGSADDGITATNYDATATIDNGTCLYDPICEPMHVTSLWWRDDCATGWCTPKIQFAWASCDLDILNNSIENPNNITILTGFSIDNGVTWTDSTTGTLYNQPNVNSFGDTSGANLAVLDMFTQWAAEGLIGSSDQFECKVRWRIKADYPTANTYYSTYKTFRILNPRINAFGWLVQTNPPPADGPNLSAGSQVFCHAGNNFNHLLFDPNLTPYHSPGSPPNDDDVVIILAPCGCTDDGYNTLANTWLVPTELPYDSPYPGIAATNLMVNANTGIDDGTCEYAGCMDPLADNYDSNATANCLSLSPMPSPACDVPSATCCCIYSGCTDPCATNYDSSATSDNGSCVLPLPVINGNWATNSGCTKEYAITVQDSIFGNLVPGIPWGFTDVDWILIYDPLGSTPLPITNSNETVDLVTVSNFVTWTYMDNCSTPTAFTQGVGLYRVMITIHYPGGSPACDITLTHDFSITASDLVVCDCLNCPTCSNYNPLATCDDGSCTGCTDPLAGGYNAGATIDDGSCLYYGCTDPSAANFDFPADATHIDDGSCLYWHIWQACGSSDQTAFGGSGGPGPVNLAANQIGLNLINPGAVVGQTFSAPWYDGAAWESEWCWEYVGPAAVPAHYPNPLNTTSAPSQWVSSVPNTTYADCTACTPVSGCTDPMAINYDPTATVDDGSCVYPCCDAPVLAQASGHVDDCDVEYEMTINCNTLATDNADTITSVLEFWDGATWQTANTDVHNPGGTDNITSHSVTYHYNCSADDFGGYGSGQYRVTTTITYSSGYTCTQVSNTEIINMGIPGCIDPLATNYNPSATCQCVTCLFSYCCDTPVLTLDLSNGICDQSLECTITCTPPADDGYTALWQEFSTGVWVTIQTDTSAAATGSVTLTLANALLHTASGTSENYRVVFTSDYTAPTPDCQVISNVLPVTAPILGCMDGGATEYTVTGAPPNATGFGTAGDGLTASNYDPTAECDDGSCCLDGCTNPLASNYNPLATCDDGSCIYGCCGTGTLAVDTVTYGLCYEALNWTSDFAACPDTPTSMIVELYDPLGALIDTNTYAAPVDGTVYHWSNTFLDTASSNNSGTFTVTVIYSFNPPLPDCPVTVTAPITFAILGCTDPLSSNYNPAATCDDGSCFYIDGCTDPQALNYNPNAINDDGSCLYCGSGCTDSAGGPYTNYDATAICDCDYTWLGMGTCSTALWFDEPSCIGHGTCSVGAWVSEADCCINNGGTWSGTSCSGGSATYTANTWTSTYLANQLVSWNACCISCTYGCTDAAYSNYNPLATCDCTETLGSEPCNAQTAALTGANCCCTNCIYGCTDTGSFNDAWWTGTNGAAYDYSTATGFSTYNDMLTLYSGINAAGANNYNSLATCEDGSCTYNGCTDPLATNYNANLTGDCLGVVAGSDWSCCVYPVTGCTDVGTPALNVTPSATVDDGSCMYCDATTGNYEDSMLVDQPTWASTTSITTPTSGSGVSDGSLFTSFTLNASGLILQALAEFQSGDNDWAIELYQVPTNGGASGTGILVTTAAIATTTTGTIWSHTFLNLPWGYYAIRLVTINNVGVVEPTQCFIEFNDIVQARVCNDPVAANYPPPVPADLRFTDNTLCAYPGYCACTATTSVVAGPPCSNTATIYAYISCATGTDVSWYWEDAGGNVLAAGATLGITVNQLISSLPITVNGTYTFNWTETSTPFATCPLQIETITTTAITQCGCTDPTMANYSISNTHDCNGDPLGTQNPGWNASPCCTACVYGCTNPGALNYDPTATCDDGSCIMPGDGCCDPLASNYNSAATNCIPAMCEYCND